MDAAAALLKGAPSALASIQSQVSGRLTMVLSELRRIVVSDFDMIEDVNEYLLLMRGKLFRPTLLLLANEVGNSPDDDAITLAAVVELVHLATLVHDDAVDHSVLRRGQPTVNALWTHQIAVIMGDYLYSRGVSELAELGNLDAVRVLATAANEMSVGEMRQLTAYDALDFTEEGYHRLIAAKTASLMSAACEMGALVGRADRIRTPLKHFGHALGMAFQIADDLLDYTGSEDVTGKPTGHDLRERKVTLPLVGALDRMSPPELERVRRFFTLVEPSDSEIQEIVGIVDHSGGLEYARARAVHFAEKADAMLGKMDPGPAIDALRQSVVYAIDRDH
ncbi:MAG: polyprenyl synthetase family protein [Gemmatimonadota bacterium]|nr:MAG: polyprenyl synthetase family protein [Gemmatimonadota bacterium]